MVQSKPRECIMVDGSRFCKSEPMTAKDIGEVLLFIPLLIIFWAATGLCVSKIVEKVFNTGWDNITPVMAGMLVPPMVVGLIILIFN